MARIINLSTEQAEQIIRHFTPTYQVVRLLGAGSYGQVFLVSDALTEVAVKVVPLALRAPDEPKNKSAAKRISSHEWAQLQQNWDRLNHTSLVRMRSVHTWSSTDLNDPVAEYGLLYMDYWPMNLYSCVKKLAKGGRLTPARQYTLLIRVAILLQRLIEDTGLIITDLKLENIMVADCGSGPLVLAMIDMGGICEERLADYYRIISTDFYKAPELYDRTLLKVDESVLVYSFGLIGLFVLEGRWPVAEYDYHVPLLLQLRAQGGPEWSPATRASLSACIQIIETCLRENRHDAPSGVEGAPIERRYPTIAAVVQALQVAYQAWIDRDRLRIAATLIAALAPPQLRSKSPWREPLTGMEFCWIPPGKFYRGQSMDETKILRKYGNAAFFNKWYARELPRHRVEMDGFWMGRLPVTRGVFAWFVEDALFQTDQERRQLSVCANVQAKQSMDQWYWNKTRFEQDDQHPVVYVSWFDAVQCAQWLSRRTGLLFALPTEAQWEYACRGGALASLPFHFGHTIHTGQANYWGDSLYGGGKPDPLVDTIITREGTTPGGLFPPNGYGLHAMHGTVWEWCQDQYDGEFYKRAEARQKNPVNCTATGYRIKRGGSWRSSPDLVRSAYRGGSYPEVSKDDIGFRLVLSSLLPVTA